MKKFEILVWIVLFVSFVAYSYDGIPMPKSFTIEGKVIDIENRKPIEAQLTFCEQIGDEIVALKQACYTENGKFKLVLPERPDKRIGNYALLVISVKDYIDPQTGKPGKTGSLLYVSRFAAVDIPDTGDVCIMPDIEMDRVIFENEVWPYPLPEKLIELERECREKYPDAY